MFQPTKVSRIIASCGTLHNFAIKHNLELLNEGNDEDDVDIYRRIENYYNVNHHQFISRNGI